MKVWKKFHYSSISPANNEQAALMQVLISAECFLGVMTAIIHFFRESLQNGLEKGSRQI